MDGLGIWVRLPVVNFLYVFFPSIEVCCAVLWSGPVHELISRYGLMGLQLWAVVPRQSLVRAMCLFPWEV